MIQATDRVLAKTLLNVLRLILKDANVTPIEGVSMLTEYTVRASQGNGDIIDGVVDLLREVSQEKYAERQGLASSIVGPVAPPWYEDAGGGL